MKILDAITGHDFGDDISDGEMVTDCIILAPVIRAGMLSVASQIDCGGWVDVEDDE